MGNEIAYIHKLIIVLTRIRAVKHGDYIIDTYELWVENEIFPLILYEFDVDIIRLENTSMK